MEEFSLEYPHNKYCSIYNPEDEIITITNNDIKFNWIRHEIARLHLNGYYLKFDGIRYNITNEGNIDNWPEGLFDINDNLITDIVTYNLKEEEIDESLVGKDVQYEQIIRPNGEIIN